MGVISVLEATHNITTKNLTTYQSEYMQSSAKTYTRPYKKPVLSGHNTWSGIPLGRVKKAEFTQSKVKSGLDTIRLYVEVTDEVAAAKIRDGTLSTVSIGGTAKSVLCSVCNKDILDEGFCGHLKGRKYEGKICTWLIGLVEYNEISFVHVPADPYAQVIIPDLEAAAKADEYAKDLWNKLKEDEGRTDAVKTADQLAQEVDNIVSELNQTYTPGSSVNESANRNNNNNSEQNTNVLDSLQAGIDNLKGKEIADEKVLRVIGIISDHLALVGKVVAKESQTEELDTIVNPVSDNKEQDELKSKLTTAEADLATSESKVNKLSGKVITLEDSYQKSQKRLLDVANLARQMVVERLVDLKVIIDSQSPNNRETLAKEFADKRLADLVAEAQAMSEKLPIARRKPGEAKREGADDDDEDVSESIDDTDGEGTKASTFADLEKSLYNLMRNQMSN